MASRCTLGCMIIIYVHALLVCIFHTIHSICVGRNCPYEINLIYNYMLKFILSNKNDYCLADIIFQLLYLISCNTKSFNFFFFLKI